MMDNSFFLCPPLHHSLQIVLFAANHRARLPYQFVESAGVTGSDAARETVFTPF